MAMILVEAAIGAVADQLLEATLEVKKKAAEYEPTLERLENILRFIGPLVNQTEELNRRLGRPAEATERLVNLMTKGRELVLKCSDEVQWWDLCDKANYQEKLEELIESICIEIPLLTLAVLTDMRAGLQNNNVPILTNQRVELRGVVCSPPEPPAFTVGLDDPLNELKQRLLQGPGSVPVVLTVSGSEGSGKTTLAKKFCWDDEVKGKFKENIFFVTCGKKPKLKTIVQKLYQHAGYEVPEAEIESDQDAVNRFKSLLCRIWQKGKGVSPILLVMDDVWQESESLVDKFVGACRAPNYRILVTSRSRFAIERFGGPYDLEPLGEPNAIQLFRHSASLNQSTPAIPDEYGVVKQIVRGCSGSPLALRVSGRSLSIRQPEVWHKRAMELSSGDVLSCLQKSLDFLDPKLKECFGDLVLFPEDQRIPATALVDIWAELHNEDDASAMKRISELDNFDMADLIVTRKVASDPVDYHCHYVTQHGLLRKLAIRQTSQEPEDKSNRLNVEINGNNLPAWWIAGNEYHIEARILSISTEWCKLQPTEVEVFVLNLRQKKYTLPMFINKMNKLKVLIITNYDIHPTELQNFEMLDHLSGLKRIRFENISIPFLSNTGVQLIKKLHKCSFSMCDVNEAFKSCNVQDSNIMPNLVEMSFDHCNMVEFPVVFSNIVSLKKLNITICHKFSALPEGIGMLVNLESLSLSSCSGLLELPDSITSLSNLKFLDISDCISLGKLPHNMRELGKLEKLDVRGCLKISNLPLSIIELEGGLKHVVCDEETAESFEILSYLLEGLKLEVAQANSSLGFLSTLRS